MKTRYLAVITIFFLFTSIITAVHKYTGLNESIPEKISELKNWRGIKILLDKEDNKKCSLIFPEKFGYKKEKEVYLLIRLINLRHFMEFDLCKPEIDKDGLNHLKYLAIQKQDKTAAWALLFPEEHQGFDLDGEALETYDSQYLVQIIDKFIQLKMLMHKKRTNADFATNICFGIRFTKDEKIDLTNILKKLKEKGLEKFAELVEEKCKEMWMK
ncbi:MAG: hypothetical protein OEZ13_03065 [Spirochaetia bacterium]|nr:hypothetical protein [Spirochaetia bacterium]